MTKELLLEIGTEELPAKFIEPLLEQMKVRASALFDGQCVQYGSVAVFGTPRRLTLWVPQLGIRQMPKSEEILGPPRKVAYDDHGNPREAGIRFAEAQGVPVDALVFRHTPKGEYVAAIKPQKGQETFFLLPGLLSDYLRDFSFQKSMRWNASGARFARPIRWILAVYGGATIPFSYAGIDAGSITFGHRYMAQKKSKKRPKGTKVKNFEAYVKSLEQQGVIVDQQQRKEIICTQLNFVADEWGGTLEYDDSLLLEAVYSVEWPHVFAAKFDPSYLDLPKDVIVTAMQEHQGFFSMVSKTGKLLPHFIAVCNVEHADMSEVVRGNERVLAARLADAKFYFEEDTKTSLDSKRSKLRAVTYQQRLGSLYEKVERLEGLSVYLAKLWALSEESKSICRRVAQLCKADLVTGMVGEFPSLQGVMGKEYATRDGESDAITDAIAEHYCPRFSGDVLPQTLPGTVVSIVDKVDAIAGYFAIGRAPTGSQDPYGLRRQAQGILQIAFSGGMPFPLRNIVHQALRAFEPVIEFQHDEVVTNILMFFRQRMESSCASEGYRYDLVRAVLERGAFDDPVDALHRIVALQKVSKDSIFVELISAFKRIINILPKAHSPMISESLFAFDAERELYEKLQHHRKTIGECLAMQRYLDAIGLLKEFKQPIDRFFVDVLVMAEDPAVRANRLSILSELHEVFHQFADFSQVVVEA